MSSSIRLACTLDIIWTVVSCHRRGAHDSTMQLPQVNGLDASYPQYGLNVVVVVSLRVWIEPPRHAITTTSCLERMCYRCQTDRGSSRTASPPSPFMFPSPNTATKLQPCARWLRSPARHGRAASLLPWAPRHQMNIGQLVSRGVVSLREMVAAT
jgi:hypothetical protein